MALPPAKALAAIGVTIREALPEDAVAGVAPRWVALPGSTSEVAAVMRAAAEHGLTVVPAGGGTKLGWGPPPRRCDLLLRTRRLDRILEHAAGDLVARVEAGVRTEALAAALAGAGQELALDIPFEGATIGGTLAAATAGPRRLRYGTARDLLIGITVVLADGTIARSGGKVVKNVAGYDLGKLFTGSQGTLGVITEATFRLHPLPSSRAWIGLTAPGLDGLPDLAALAASQAEPSAVEIDWPGVDAPLSIAALFEGVAAGERAKAAVASLGLGKTAGEPVGGTGGESAAGVGAACRLPADAGDSRGGAPSIAFEPPAWWGRLPGEEFLLEMRVPPGAAVQALAQVARSAREAGDVPVRVRGSVVSAVLHVALPGDTHAQQAERFVSGLRSGLAAHGGRLVVWTAPPDAASRLDRWGPVGAATLMRRVKERFDPEERLSPGRLPGIPPSSGRQSGGGPPSAGRPSAGETPSEGRPAGGGPPSGGGERV
ncbi:FAD-binding oxidoreductase [Sphaerisporangium perillae]|uniref:FAD-binding oxidoreductase n=1 Tax=Sphaerisporangium perillae TaxID=2935860 RepID=UPI00200FF136|nr:FAD-binding oxidoreductase [Sphaerisporangium perillae]